ncbi:alpha/beta hydrolase family protein [Actinomadura sp. 6N118]|uniref:alpha/beta hydrolase family protein n=1 Tax=Actinomadura sp. 6N118 TaxID=3375151 RepID=UPI0037946F74
MRSRTTALTALMLAFPLVTACGAGADATRTANGTTRTQPVSFELPAPTGKQAIGTTELHLVDKARRDPWVKDKTRELMISFWYPARANTLPRAPYLRPTVAKLASQAEAFGIFKPGQVDWAGARTHAAEAAPADLRRGPRPVVLYSPGFGVPRAAGTTAVEELVSRGYVVVTMDHTYETSLVEFPGGRVEQQTLPPQSPARTRTALGTRVADTRFVLDRLAALRAGHNPDAERRRLPRGLGAALDLSRVGAFGHSAGGIQAAETMRVDRRLDAGIDLDGTMQYAPGDLVQVARTGLDRPFMLMGAATGGELQTHLTNPSWGSFWNNSRGWKRDLNVPQGSHYSFTDLQSILPAVGRQTELPADKVKDFVGTVDADRMVASQRTYVTAFFDRHLRRLARPVLDGPSPQHPDFRFIR